MADSEVDTFCHGQPLDHQCTTTLTRSGSPAGYHHGIPACWRGQRGPQKEEQLLDRDRECAPCSLRTSPCHNITGSMARLHGKGFGKKGECKTCRDVGEADRGRLQGVHQPGRCRHCAHQPIHCQHDTAPHRQLHRGEQHPVQCQCLTSGAASTCVCQCPLQPLPACGLCMTAAMAAEPDLPCLIMTDAVIACS